MTDLEGILYRLERIERLLKETRKASRWISLKEAVEYCGLSDSTVRRLVYSGRLRCSRKSGKLLFRTTWLDRWLMFGKNRLTAKEKKKLAGL